MQHKRRILNQDAVALQLQNSSEVAIGWMWWCQRHIFRDRRFHGRLHTRQNHGWEELAVSNRFAVVLSSIGGFPTRLVTEVEHHPSHDKILKCPG